MSTSGRHPSLPPGVLHVVVPASVDDPARPSGGNHYDRRICEELAGLGWALHQHRVAGEWPTPDADAVAALAGVLAAVPDGGLVLLDGLVGTAAPAALLPHAGRLRLVMLVHLPFGVAQPLLRLAERGVLQRCAGMVATSEWTRSWLLRRYGLEPGRVCVVPPGVDPAPPASGTPTGGALLVVGRVSRLKGHDVLASALAGIADLSWTCDCVGATDQMLFARALRERLRRAGLADRVRLRGVLAHAEMGEAYAAADLLVAPSRAETYGMVITEALAHGLPVVGSSVGGVPEAVGRAPGGRRPGLLVRPGDAEVLGRALRWWLSDARLRDDLRDAAQARRLTLAGWDAAAKGLVDALRRTR